MILNSYYICCLWKVKYYRHPPQKVSLVHIQAASIEREREVERKHSSQKFMRYSRCTARLKSHVKIRFQYDLNERMHTLGCVHVPNI